MWTEIAPRPWQCSKSGATVNPPITSASLEIEMSPPVAGATAIVSNGNGAAAQGRRVLRASDWLAAQRYFCPAAFQPHLLLSELYQNLLMCRWFINSDSKSVSIWSLEDGWSKMISNRFWAIYFREFVHFPSFYSTYVEGEQLLCLSVCSTGDGPCLGSRLPNQPYKWMSYKEVSAIQGARPPLPDKQQLQS